MKADETLSAFFGGQTPPDRDLGFQAEVAERIACRRAIATVLALVPWTIAFIALLWALGPLLGPPLIAFSQTLAPAAGILALTAFAVGVSLTAGRRLEPA